jgi:hypothetical protein
MASNPPIGTNAWEGPLGVVNVTFNGVEMGKTTADTEIVPDEDLKDIIYQQDGTKYQDKIRTGIAWQVNVTFGEISTTLLEDLLEGWEKSAGGDSLKMNKSLYQSMRNNEAHVLKLTRVDSEGTSSTDPRHVITFYKAAAQVTGNIQWGADTQRNLAVTFYIFWDETEKAFGYSGFFSSLGMNKAV